jgi:hypothetical protein
MGAPGCPEFARCTASILSALIAFANSDRETAVTAMKPTLSPLKFKRRYFPLCGVGRQLKAGAQGHNSQIKSPHTRKYINIF